MLPYVADTLNYLDNAMAGCTSGYIRRGHTSDFTHGQMAVAHGGATVFYGYVK